MLIFIFLRHVHGVNEMRAADGRERECEVMFLVGPVCMFTIYDMNERNFQDECGSDANKNIPQACKTLLPRERAFMC